MDKNLQPDIPLGAKGKLHGITWEVKGYIVKFYSFSIQWKEYLLHNPTKGYRWLTEIDGHWNYVIVLHKAPKPIDSLNVQYLNQNYRLFHHSNSTVKYFAGEFDWPIQKDEKNYYQEYIYPPYILTLATNANNENPIWSLGQYIDANIVANAFECHAPYFPPVIGVAPNEPCLYKIKQSPVSIATAIFSVILVAFYIGLSSFFPPKTVVTLQENLQTTEVEIVSEPFQLENPIGTVRISIHAPTLSNQWIETDLALVNLKTGHAYALGTGLEYYEGYSGDEYWSEGSHVKNLELSSIPIGDYQLVVNTNASAETPVTIQVLDGIPTYFDLLACLALFLVYPLWVLYRRWRFNKERWNESDYSPYFSSNDDE